MATRIQSGRKHGPFDEKLFTRSLVQGLDPAGNEMAVAMPRFEMSPEDMADLIAYLKRIESDRDPGLTETSVKVATILPQRGGARRNRRGDEGRAHRILRKRQRKRRDLQPQN